MSAQVSPADRSMGRSAGAIAESKMNPLYWIITLVVVILDVLSKAYAVDNLVRHVPENVIGDYVRFTLAYNPGAAFGLHLGAASRWIFAVLAVIIVTVLLRSTRELVQQSRLAAIGVPIVIGGAVGNLLDRIRFREGVVDFIDVGVGAVRFWTFNVADSAVTVGAICLVIALWRHDETPKAL